MTTQNRTNYYGKRLIPLTLKAIISLILLFVIGCSMQRGSSAGRINGVYIKRQDFMTSLRGHYTGFMLEKDRSPDESEKRELYRQAWRSIAIHVILKDYFKQYQISVTPKEVIDTLLNNVPPSIVKAPVFQNNGVFDRTKYVTELLSDKSNQLTWLKSHYYEYYVPLAKLKLELQKKGIIDKRELANLSKVLNSSADIDWIVFDPARADVKVSQADIDNYYLSNQKKYEIKPTISLGWTAVPIKLSQDDVNATKTRIDSIYYEMYNGKSYAMMVERFSQSPTFVSGGSLGFKKTEELPEVVFRAISGLNKNDITRPVRVENTWVIYQLVERTQNLVKLNELVLNILPGPVTRSQTQDTAIHLRDLAQQLGLATAAREMNLRYRTTGTVPNDSLWLADGDISSYITNRAFTQKAGSLLEPVYSERMQVWIVAEVIDVQPFQYKSVFSVSDEISAHILQEKQKAKALEDARNWSQQYKTKQLDMAKQFGYEIVSTPAIDIDGTVFSEHIRKIYVGIINDYEGKKAPSPSLLGNYVLLPVVSRVYETNPPKFLQNDVRKYFFNNINTDWFDKWLEDELRKADISIWFTYP